MNTTLSAERVSCLGNVDLAQQTVVSNIQRQNSIKIDGWKMAMRTIASVLFLVDRPAGEHWFY
jgi:hypothetical protein